MAGIKDDLRHTGYSLEEIYFHRQNVECLEKYREKLAKQKAKGAVEAKTDSGPPGQVTAFKLKQDSLKKAA